MSSDQPNQEEQDERCFDRKFFISLIVGISLTIAVLYYFYQYPAFAQIAIETGTESVEIPTTPIITEWKPLAPLKDEIARTENTITTENPDGSRTIRIYAEPDTFRKTDTGLWFVNEVSAAIATASGDKDTEIVSNLPTSNQGSNASIYLQNNANRRPMFAFTLPADLGTIVSASINIRNHNSTDGFDSGNIVSVHQISDHDDWVESEVTWNIAHTGGNWGTAGGDFNPVPNTWGTPVTTNEAWNRWMIYGDTAASDATLAWGAQTTFFLKVATESNAQDYLYLHTKETAGTDSDPYFEITYTATPPAETFTDEQYINLLLVFLVVIGFFDLLRRIFMKKS